MIRRRLLNVWTRIRATVLNEPRDPEFQTEIEEHVRLLSERYRGQGMTAHAAMLAARRSLVYCLSTTAWRKTSVGLAG